MMATLARTTSDVLKINRISCLVTQQVRFKRREPLRKAIWLPMAPSKLFKITPLPKISPEERELTEKLTFDYEAALCSIREHCRQNFYLPATKTEDGSKTELELKAEEEFKRALKRNDEENKRIAALRVKRREEEWNEFKSYLLELEAEHNLKQSQLDAEARANVEIETRRSASFISKDKLAEAIEEALLNPVHYEWAVDRQGKVYYDGAIHPNAFTPTAVPDTSNHKDLAMKELPKNFRLKAHKLY